MFNELVKLTKDLRGFKAEEYLDLKIKKINKFFKDEELDSVIVGISGGIDSAVTLELLLAASKVKGSPIKEVLGVIAPIYSNGVTGQKQATRKAQQLCSNRGMRFATVDLTDAYESIIRESIYEPDAWAKGQMASVLRTPVFYYHAAILQSEGLKSIVAGTTNRTEYLLGFYGKASDAMVDLQILFDVHKSEVYQTAKLLNVPREIIDSKPNGDVYNGKIDEELINSPYWFTEMYLIMKEYNLYVNISLTREEENQFIKWGSNIDELCIKNSHKFKVGLPSRFVDVMPRTGIPGGWN
jgi:NAD+ synthase (glutamine-hydrolysing)